MFLSTSMRLLGAMSLLAPFVSAAPGIKLDTMDKRQATDRLVFCHFMVGIMSDRTSSADYDGDMIRAKALGIDAFALNIGTDDYTDAQLGYAYESAANNDMNVFISFDFNWYSPSAGAAAVGAMIAKYGSLAAQLKYDGKVFASSFSGDGLDVAAMRAAAGVDVFFVPNFHVGQSDFSTIDGAFNWIAWDNNGNNKAPTPGANVTVEEGDASYIAALGGKPYLAPISPWFSTHYGPEVSYSKNWVFPSDLLWFRRWTEILTIGPQFTEIITWNDYGESHYIGPLSSKHNDDGNSKWTNDMPHDGWLDMAKPFIAAYKAGATTVDEYINEDQLVYWYRPNLRTLDCDATDTTLVAANNDSGNYFMGRPNGWEDMQDSVFVVSLLTTAGTVTVTSGSNVQTFDAPAGASSFQVDMGVGKQQFSLSRNGATVFSGDSLRDITDVCPCGLYNFNSYVGTLPAGASDPLGADGLASLTVGLHVTTCAAQPSLGTNPATTTGVDGGVTKIVTTTTAATTTTTGSSQPTSTSVCIAGEGDGNLGGLCSFSCNFGYCPSPCTCTAYGAAVTAPTLTGADGIPLAGEGDEYIGLCSFVCSHGYCPVTACTQT